MHSDREAIYSLIVAPLVLILMQMRGAAFIVLTVLGALWGLFYIVRDTIRSGRMPTPRPEGWP